MKQILLLTFLSMGILFSNCNSDDLNPDDEGTCIDGIQNGNETGVDCGGDCDPCVITPTAEIYFQGEINGSNVLIEAKSGLFALGGVGTEAGVNNCNMDFSAYIGDIFNDEYVPVLSIDLMNFFVTSGPGCDEQLLQSMWPDLFGASEYSYWTGGMTTKEVLIGFIDEDNNVWSSELGTQPSSSKFEILSAEEVETSPTTIEAKVKGTMNCTLFNNNGESVELKNGAFTYIFYY